MPRRVLMGHCTVHPLDNSRYHHMFLELQNDNYNDALHTLCVHAIPNQFWQYPFSNAYCLAQSNELHQLHLKLVKDILHLLLKDPKARNVNNQFDPRFTLVP
jgi:hypothetical protein